MTRCKRARDEREPLELDLPERKILLKRRRHASIASSCRERLDAHRLIEEFMILANVAAAETLEKKALPLIYRVHDEPSLEKVHALREFLKTLDIPFAKSGALRPVAVQPRAGAGRRARTTSPWSTRWCCARRRRPNIRRRITAISA